MPITGSMRAGGSPGNIGIYPDLHVQKCAETVIGIISGPAAVHDQETRIITLPGILGNCPMEA
jgi:hypothetical protein